MTVLFNSVLAARRNDIPGCIEIKGVSMQFLQLGRWIFAIDRILAIDIANNEAGCPCVALWVAGHNEAWYFPQESEEAKALLKWAKLNAKRLVGFEQPGGAQ